MNLYEELRKAQWNVKLQIARILKGWTQSEAAQKCGTSQKNFWGWESGRTFPRGNSRKAIIAAFEIKEDIFEKPETKKED